MGRGTCARGPQDSNHISITASAWRGPVDLGRGYEPGDDCPDTGDAARRDPRRCRCARATVISQAVAVVLPARRRRPSGFARDRLCWCFGSRRAPSNSTTGTPIRERALFCLSAPLSYYARKLQELFCTSSRPIHIESSSSVSGSFSMISSDRILSFLHRKQATARKVPSPKPIAWVR